MKTEEDFANLKQVFEDGMRKQYPKHSVSVGVIHDGWNLCITYNVDAHEVKKLEMSGVRDMDLAYTIFNISIISFLSGVKTHVLIQPGSANHDPIGPDVQWSFNSNQSQGVQDAEN